MGSPIVNPFAGANLGFELSEFATSFSVNPNLHDRVGRMFTDRPGTTTTVLIERLVGSLNIVSSIPRGAPAPKVTADKRDMRPVSVPHFAVQDVVTPGEVQDVRQMGSIAAKTNAAVLNAKQVKMKNILDQTAEFLACGALNGILYDADGTVMLNLYDFWGVNQKVVDFALDSDATIVMDKVIEAVEHVEDNLKGETYTGIRCLCTRAFFKALVSHPEVEKAFVNYQVLNQNLAGDYRRGFTFGNVTFEVYSATWTDAEGNVRAAIPTNSGILYPEGTTEAFVRYIAPGDFMDAVNQMGQVYYARMEEKRFGQGYDLWAESNVLPICLRPDLLVTVTI